MNLNRHKRRVSPAELKQLIEKTELIESKNLGLLICDDGELYQAIHIYKEAYQNYTSKELVLMMVSLNQINMFLCIKRKQNESACSLNNKRLILDALNSLRLTMEPNSLLKDLVRGARRLFAKENEHKSSSFNERAIKSYVSIFGFRAVSSKINFTDKEGESYLNHSRMTRGNSAKETFAWGLYEVDEFKKDYCKWVWKSAGTKKNNLEQ